ncbi:MAG: hypothetical protein ACLFNT_07365 [Spirochaetales bacterium]
MFTNDGSSKVPEMRAYLHEGCVQKLPDSSSVPEAAVGGSPPERAAALRAAGFVGIQGPEVAHYAAVGLGVATLGRANTTEEIDAFARAAAADKYECGTMHIGWGFEDDAQIDRLARAVVQATRDHEIPLFVETHRATILQDPYRTLKLIERVPEIRLNGDFSHWYTGCEMVYGDIEEKFDLLAPVFERVGFIHARVGNSSNMQVTVHDPSMKVALDHYREMWKRSFSGFKRHAQPGDYIIFAPELLEPSINYARLYKSSDGEWREDSDRWEESIKLVEIATECFAVA